MRMSFVLVGFVVATVVAGARVSEAEGGRDVVVVNRAGSRALSEAEIGNLAPVRNALPPPDTSGVVPEVGSGPHAPGARGRDGVETEASRDFGSFGIPYTTTRVQDGGRPASGATVASRMSTTYPYATIGKLTFSGGYCSASLIARSVIVTAAHCIQAFGSGNNRYTNFQFRPGHYGASGATAAQLAPFGTWTWTRLVRPGSWASGTDVGSGSARDNDIAVIALAKNAQGQLVGDLTGWLTYGWNNYSFVSSPKTGNLLTAAMSTLGYPALMDGGAIMQRTDGPSYTTTIGGAGQLQQGSNLTGGASGGPWIVNFSTRDAALSGGATPGSAPGITVVGVTSWGAQDPNNPKDNFSSQFRQNSRYPNASYGVYGAGNIAALLNTLCGGSAPEGGTLASQGYCD